MSRTNLPTRRDPLLTTARLVLGLFLGLLSAVMVLVGIGIAAVLTVQRGEILAKIAAEDLAPATYWGVVFGLVAVLAILFCALRFVIELRNIVTSVDEGDPFVPENARRLGRMAWLVLAIQLIAIPVGFAAAIVARMSESVSAEAGASGGGFVLALTLFILARVFRTGSVMRAELEGTV